jgi:hypothetical protein
MSGLSKTELENIIARYEYRMFQQDGGWCARKDIHNPKPYSALQQEYERHIDTPIYAGHSYYWALSRIASWIIMYEAHSHQLQ